MGGLFIRIRNQIAFLTQIPYYMNSLQPPITAVIFDMDGLMIDTERMAQRAWQRAGAEFGFALPDALYLQAVGRTAKATEALFRAGLGADFPFEAVYERKQHYLYTTIEQEGIPTKPGLLELLDLVDRLALHKAVATSTARVLAIKKLTAAALLQRFDTLVCGDEVPNGKPAPDIFLAAAQKLGAAPEQCVVLEDSSAGIKAAHAAGMRAIMVPDLIQPTAEITPLAYCVMEDLHQVIALLS
jgi:HAD superfamily hydrolase (TIGR01509 family)